MLARNAYVQAFVRTHTKPPTEAELRANYDSALAQSCASRRFISHIVVASEDAAKAVAAQLATGSSFAEVAAKRSTDAQTAERGGKLGCIDGQELGPAFAVAVAALPLGQVSAPVQTDSGWHIITAQDVEQALPFDSVKDEIRNDLVERGAAGQRKLVAQIARGEGEDRCPGWGDGWCRTVTGRSSHRRRRRPRPPPPPPLLLDVDVGAALRRARAPLGGEGRKVETVDGRDPGFGVLTAPTVTRGGCSIPGPSADDRRPTP